MNIYLKVLFGVLSLAWVGIVLAVLHSWWQERREMKEHPERFERDRITGKLLPRSRPW